MFLNAIYNYFPWPSYVISWNSVLSVSLRENNAMAKETVLVLSSFSIDFVSVSHKTKILPADREKQITDHPDHTIAR